MTPWTPRERALYEALEKIRDEAETPLLEPDGESVAMMLCCYCGNVPHEKECPHFIASAALADPPPPDPRDESLRLAEAELLRLWKLVPAGRAGVGGVRTIELEDDEVARLRQIVDAIRAAKGGA